MALERGFVADGNRPGCFRDPENPEFSYNAGAQIVGGLDCWRCYDVHYVKVPPRGRLSKGAWDHDLVMCECMKEAQP